MAASKKNGQKRPQEQQDGQEQKNSGTEPPNTGWTGEVPNKEGGSEEGYLFKPPYAWMSKEFKATYHASCFCKKVEFEFHGDPIDAKHCHCTQCQKLHGAPFQWAALYHKTSVRLKHSCDPMYLNFYSTQEMKSDHSVPCKISCKNCGSPVFDEGRNMVMAYPSSFAFKDNHVPAAFAPSCHIFYGNRSMNIDDDVPKWKGHKEKSEQMDHAPSNDEKTMGKGKKHKAEDTIKSEQSPRRPTNLPTGASSLSDRIAALQRKSSVSTASSRRSASATSSLNNTIDDSLNNGTTISARSSSSGSQAVKDRIARFQVNEKPLLPKSSFGAPTPMATGRQGNALRPYPGANASGSGSGQWGENILRPQMTGGVWSGGGEGGKGWTDNATLRPQMTGTPWMGTGGRSLSPSPNSSNRILGGQSPSNNLSRSPIRHRDAFLDLEEENKGSSSLTPPKSTPMRRGSSFSDAQMAAASAGLATNSRRSSAEDEKNGKMIVNFNYQSESKGMTLPILPDTPTKMTGLVRGPSSTLGLTTFASAGSETLILPTPPTSIPKIEEAIIPRDVRTRGDVEIGIGGASPAKIEQLRRSLSGNLEDVQSSISPTRAAGEIPSAPAPFLQELLSSREGYKAAPSSSIKEEEAEFAQMKVSSSTIKEELIDKIQSDISRDSVAETKELNQVAVSNLSHSNEADQEQMSLASNTPSITAASTSQDSNLKVTSATQSRDTISGQLSGEVRNSSINGSNSNGTLTSSTTSATLIPTDENIKAVPTLASNTDSEAERNASEAISLARKKSESQRIKKPPLGRPMTAAEMDASDDEYEPGWASVLSATSSRT